MLLPPLEPTLGPMAFKTHLCRCSGAHLYAVALRTLRGVGCLSPGIAMQEILLPPQKKTVLQRLQPGQRWHCHCSHISYDPYRAGDRVLHVNPSPQKQLRGAGPWECWPPPHLCTACPAVPLPLSLTQPLPAAAGKLFPVVHTRQSKTARHQSRGHFLGAENWEEAPTGKGHPVETWAGSHGMCPHGDRTRLHPLAGVHFPHTGASRSTFLIDALLLTYH